MKTLLLILALFFMSACSPEGEGDTVINVAAGNDSAAGDPVTDIDSGCANSEDGCGQQVEN